jgi:WD40 repeat protein
LVSVAADGRTALTSDGTWAARLWDLQTGRCLQVLDGHPGRIFSVSLSADARVAAVGSAEGTVRLWELDWDVEFPDRVAWHDDARPHLETFIASGGTGSDNDVQQLLTRLQDADLGWVDPDGVRAELARMKAPKASRWSRFHRRR